MSAPQSTHQIWTALQHDGPNHLGLWCVLEGPAHLVEEILGVRGVGFEQPLPTRGVAVLPLQRDEEGLRTIGARVVRQQSAAAAGGAARLGGAA